MIQSCFVCTESYVTPEDAATSQIPRMTWTQRSGEVRGGFRDFKKFALIYVANQRRL
jgi:hypothetical protein